MKRFLIIALSVATLLLLLTFASVGFYGYPIVMGLLAAFLIAELESEGILISLFLVIACGLLFGRLSDFWIFLAVISVVYLVNYQTRTLGQFYRLILSASAGCVVFLTTQIILNLSFIDISETFWKSLQYFIFSIIFSFFFYAIAKRIKLFAKIEER